MEIPSGVEGHIDQAHEQNNAAIKGDGSAVCVTDNSRALRQWTMAGPEVARLIEEFQDATEPDNQSQDTKHHDQSASVQTAFLKDVVNDQSDGRLREYI